MKALEEPARDGKCESPWQSGLPVIQDSVTIKTTAEVFDCLVTGAGITGLSTALLLQKANLKIDVAEAHTIASARPDAVLR